MVSDKHNQIYTDLLNHMKSIYPKLKGGTKYDGNEPKFPYLYFYQIDGTTRLTTLSNTEDGISLVFQIEIYTKGGDNEARKMANEVRAYMISQGFRCMNFIPMQGNSDVSRFVMRYGRLDV